MAKAASMHDIAPKQINQLDNLSRTILASEESERQLIAIYGAPGSGKSTLAAALGVNINAASPGSCTIVPMDGFHLDDGVLRERGLLHRKGAPETFDVDGFLHLHQQLLDNTGEPIAVPLFDRSMELSRAGARIIAPSVRTILIEGNYLLLQQPRWAELAHFYHLTVQVDVPISELERRLMMRWLEQGLSADQARAKVRDNDLPNAQLVIARSRAPKIVFAGA